MDFFEMVANTKHTKANNFDEQTYTHINARSHTERSIQATAIGAIWRLREVYDNSYMFTDIRTASQSRAEQT